MIEGILITLQCLCKGNPDMVTFDCFGSLLRTLLLMSSSTIFVTSQSSTK